MKTPCKCAAYFVFLWVCFLASAISNAQDTSIGQARQKQLLQALRPICERFVLQIVTQKEIQPALTVRPIDTTSVCNCAEAKISADPRLERFWPLSEKDMKGRMESDEVKSYITVRMITSNLECLAQDLETSLQSAELPQ